MLTDAYVQFGEQEVQDSAELDAEDPADRETLREIRKPLIPGDSDDDDHYWWCELRGCDFSLETADRGTDSDTEGDDEEDKESNPSFKPVTLKKRFDWASTELFYRCCIAGREKIDKSQDDTARINKVTVEVCRTAARRDQTENFNFPFLVIRYHGVRIQSYKIDLSSPEPAETIVFEFEELDVQFQPTDPYTGLKVGSPMTLNRLKNHNESVGKTRGQQTGGRAVQHDTPSGGGRTAGGDNAAVTQGDETTMPPGASNLVSTGVSFPGLQPLNGPGVLPQ